MEVYKKRFYPNEDATGVVHITFLKKRKREAIFGPQRDWIILWCCLNDLQVEFRSLQDFPFPRLYLLLQVPQA